MPSQNVQTVLRKGGEETCWLETQMATEQFLIMD